MYDILFGRTSYPLGERLRWRNRNFIAEFPFERFLHRFYTEKKNKNKLLKVFIIMKETLTEQVMIGIFLILKGKSSVRNVIDVLQPLEVRNGHTSRVHV